MNNSGSPVNVHVHHRERMLEKLSTTPSELFPDHEILEMILFYSRPRVNTNEIAHRLIDRFGSIRGVLDADIDELLKTDGVGKSSALLIKLIRECALNYVAVSKIRPQKPMSEKEVGEYFVRKLGMKCREEVMVMLLDNSGGFIDARTLFSGVVNYTPISYRKVFEYACTRNAAALYIAHNHPDGLPVPSDEDIENTLDIKSICNSLGLEFKDHIIVAGDKYVSVLGSLSKPRKSI